MSTKTAQKDTKANAQASKSAETTNTPAKKRVAKGPYKLTCSVTGETVQTTPDVFAKRATQYKGIDENTLRANYVGKKAQEAIRSLIIKDGLQEGSVEDQRKAAHDAVKAIRSEFGIDIKTQLPDAIVDHITAKLRAKAKKENRGKVFAAKAAKAWANLGIAPKAEQKDATHPAPPEPAKDEPKTTTKANKSK